MLYEFGRQPRASRELFTKYQDRVLFGKGRVREVRISVLLAGVRNEGRILRLLPRLSRFLEAVWNGSARRGPEEAVLQECLADHSRTSSDRLAEIGWFHGVTEHTVHSFENPLWPLCLRGKQAADVHKSYKRGIAGRAVPLIPLSSAASFCLRGRTAHDRSGFARHAGHDRATRHRHAAAGAGDCGAKREIARARPGRFF